MPEAMTAYYAAVVVIGAVGASESRDASIRGSKIAKTREGRINQQLADWENTYGTVEDNLSEYYNSLTPDSLIAQGLQTNQLEFQKAKERIRVEMTQRGLEDSGAEVAVNTSLEMQRAMSRARVRQEAPEIVRRQQTAFLETGLKKKQQLETELSDLQRDKEAQARGEAQALGQSSSKLLMTGMKGLSETGSTETVDTTTNTSIGGATSSANDSQLYDTTGRYRT